MFDTALAPECVRQLADWLASGIVGMAWVTGHPGSGMTSLVKHLTRAMETVWITSGSLKSRGFLRDVCSNPFAINGKRKVLVFDELDVLLGNETAVLDLAYIMKHNTQVPVVCVLKATRAATTCDLVKKASLVVRFPPPTHDAMTRAVRAVALAEGLPTVNVDALCARTPGDIRHVLETLRAGSKHTRDLTLQTADALMEVRRPGCTIRRVLDTLASDSGAVASAVFETYHQGTSIEDTLTYLDMASWADVIDEHIHNKHRWELLDAYATLAIASAAVTLPPVTPKLDKYGVAWNKRYLQCSKTKSLKAINHSRRTRGLTAWGAEDLAFVRRMVLARLPDSPESVIAIASSAGLEPGNLLELMRLWDSGYKLNTHNRIKKAWAGACAPLE